MNRVLVVFSDGLLSELDSTRGLVSRSAWIRRAVENELGRDRVFKATYGTKAFDAMKSKEAVAPLVPADEVDWQAMALSGPIPTLNEFDTHKAKPKARRKKSVKVPDQPVSVMNRGGPALTTQEPSLLPARCNRGACRGTINPVSGRCLRCNQTPLKESK